MTEFSHLIVCKEYSVCLAVALRLSLLYDAALFRLANEGPHMKTQHFRFSLVASAALLASALTVSQAGDAYIVLEGHESPVPSVEYSPDGRMIATVSQDETVRLWDAVAGKLIMTLEGHTDEVWGVAFSPDGKTLASVGDDKVALLWDVQTGDLKIKTEELDDLLWGVAFSPDGIRRWRSALTTERS